ncbi:MAG: sensor histidine kinase [Acidimicrobiia bacterium]
MSVTRRWAPDPRVLVDLVVAAVVAVLSVLDVASASAEGMPGERPADAVAYALVVAGSVTLVWRRRAPIAVLAVVTAVVATFWLRDHGAFLSVLGLSAFFAVAAHAEHRRRAWWALGLAWVAMMVAASVSLLDTADGFGYLTAFSVAAFLIGAIAAGVIVRNRERIFVDTERRAAAAEADRVAEAERAVVRERSRIAREMHDVVAHSMSVVAVQAAAGREIVHIDPDKAAEVFARIEAVGRESLTELRRMLGVLRDAGDEAASLTPQPGIAEIAAAVAQSSATGVATELIVEGRQRALAPGIELTAFRIVQEALTNVRKHAGRSASATVRISYETDDLVVEVIDDGCGAATSLSGVGTGNGLIGMRERVEIYGGEFTSGPRRGGGYVVRATLPVVSTGNADGRGPASAAHTIAGTS